MAGKRKARKASTTSSEEEISRIPCPGIIDNANAMEAKVESEVYPDPNRSPLKKTSKIPKAFLRRSSRLKNSPLPSGVETVVEHVNLVETEATEASDLHQLKVPVMMEENSHDGSLRAEEVETEPPVNEKISEKEALDVEQIGVLQPRNNRNVEEVAQQVQQVTALSIGNLRNIKEKVDYLVRTVDQFKTMSPARTSTSSSTDLSYKSLYIHSQKKIEALMEENRELMGQLEFARGKVEAYESMKNAFGAKEVIVVSSLGNAIEPASLHKWTAAVAADDVDHKTSPKPIQKKNSETSQDDLKASPKQKQKQSQKKKRRN